MSFSHTSQLSTNLQSLSPSAVVGASLSWFPVSGIDVLYLYSSKIQSTRCARSKSPPAQSNGTGHAWLKRWKGTGQPTESGHGIMGGSMGKIYIKVRSESRQKVKLCKNASHIEIGLEWEATVERVCEIIRPLIEFSRYMARRQSTARDME